ncbi:MAG TPA: RidA family protein [Steroidobacter sp.]
MSQTIKRIECGPRMSQAVVHNGTVYLAGQVAPASAGASVREQTLAILARIESLLAQAGTDKTKLLSASIWLADMSTFAEMNEVWDQWVPAGCAPARATVEARLASPDYRVEIAVVAAIG